MNDNLHVDSMQQIQHKKFRTESLFNEHFGEEVLPVGHAFPARH
jgi:hypothetical protein